MAKKKGKTLNISAGFHLVVKVNEGVDVDELLRNNTEWIGESTNEDGVVISMRLTSLGEKAVKNSIKSKVKQSYFESLS